MADTIGELTVKELRVHTVPNNIGRTKKMGGMVLKCVNPTIYRKISTIRALREFLHNGLAEAKDMVDHAIDPDGVLILIPAAATWGQYQKLRNEILEYGYTVTLNER